MLFMILLESGMGYLTEARLKAQGWTSLVEELEKNQYIRLKRSVQGKKDSQAHGVNMNTYPVTGTVPEHALKRDVILSKDAAFFVAPLQKQNPLLR